MGDALFAEISVLAGMVSNMPFHDAHHYNDVTLCCLMCAHVCVCLCMCTLQVAVIKVQLK